MLDITVEDIERVLGKQAKKQGRRYVFQCPVCMDNGEDNLVFDPVKGILKCFSCDEGSKTVLRMINKTKEKCSYIPKEPSKSGSKWYEINKDNLFNYLLATENELSSKAKNYLYNRCINNKVISLCGIGYDEKPSMVKIGASVTFPMFSLNHNEQLVGFELRQITGGKVIKHTLDSPSCLCVIYGRRTAKKIIITEGFIDAYSLLELLDDKKEEYLIVTGSHGCKSILPSLKGLDFSQFETCYLILDNDEAGDKATKEIIENYPFFKDKRNLIKECKDINEYLCKKNLK